MKKWIHASEDEWEWSPFMKGIYRIDGEVSNTKWTNDPKVAIRYWYRMQKSSPMDVAISCEKRDQAVELCQAGTFSFLADLDEKYVCPYKLDYMVEQCEKQVANGCRYFHENEYGYGDMVHPFDVG